MKIKIKIKMFFNNDTDNNNKRIQKNNTRMYQNDHNKIIITVKIVISMTRMK